MPRSQSVGGEGDAVIPTPPARRLVDGALAGVRKKRGIMTGPLTTAGVNTGNSLSHFYRSILMNVTVTPIRNIFIENDGKGSGICT